MSEKTPKIGPPTPLTPQNQFFFMRGIVLILTKAKKNHNFALWGKPKLLGRGRRGGVVGASRSVD